MSPDAHDRAMLLLDAVEPLTPASQRWLDLHLAECAACAHYAELSRRASSALRAFAFEVDPAAALRVNAAVHARLEQRRARAGVAAALALTVLGSAIAWQAVAWWAARVNVPAPVWQSAFTFFWILPSILLDAVLVFRPQGGAQ